MYTGEEGEQRRERWRGARVNLRSCREGRGLLSSHLLREQGHEVPGGRTTLQMQGGDNRAEFKQGCKSVPAQCHGRHLGLCHGRHLG